MRWRAPPASTATTASSSTSIAGRRIRIIWAAGDCARHPSIHYGTRVRLESVDNAFEQGTSAALNMLGIATVHDKVPWFWSDQFDLKMVIVGLSAAHDEVVLRGDPASRAFSVCYLRDGELIAVETINHTKDQMAARKLIPARARPDLGEARRSGAAAEGLPLARAPAREHALDVAVGIVPDDAAHELAPELAVAVELHLAVELVGGGLVRKLGIRAPVAVDVGAQVLAQQRLQIEDLAAACRRRSSRGRPGAPARAVPVAAVDRRVRADVDAGAEIGARALHRLAEIGERACRDPRPHR